MLVNNFSAGIVGMLCAILAFIFIGAFVKILSGGLAAGVNFLVSAHLLPLTNLVEPAKILWPCTDQPRYLLSAVIQQASGLVNRSSSNRANENYGLGILLAYAVLVNCSSSNYHRIHFFGGIHEIYFPYILMNPRLILRLSQVVWLVFVLTIFNAGIVSQHHRFNLCNLVMTQKGSIVGSTSIAAATGVSFAAAALLMKTQTSAEEDGDEAAQEKQHANERHEICIPKRCGGKQQKVMT